MNFRDSYEFYPESYAGNDGLVDRLLASIGRQPRVGPDVMPNTAPETSSNGFASLQGGLLGRLLALNAEQGSYQPVLENGGRTPPAVLNPNSNQLQRSPIATQPGGRISPFNLSDTQPIPVHSAFGESAALDLLRTSRQQQDRYQPTTTSSVVSQRRMLAESIVDTGRHLGIDPLDLATAISYETGGTFDPWKAGPVTQHGQHRGLIQWGEPQAQYYGITKDSTVSEQMEAVGKYLRKSGVVPGMNLLNIYSAINTGRVGRFHLSDADNGGAPGTVADKVAGMGAHRLKATRLLAEHGPATFPTASETPVRILTRRTVGKLHPSDGDLPAQEWSVPSAMFDPRR